MQEIIASKRGRDIRNRVEETEQRLLVALLHCSCMINDSTKPKQNTMQIFKTKVQKAIQVNDLYNVSFFS